MLNMVKAERLKLRHTFGAFLPAIAPVFTVSLVLPWTGTLGTAFAAGVWNWWYTLLLPGMLAIFCDLCMKKDRKTGYVHLLYLPVSAGECVAGKLICCSLGLVLANAFVFLGTCAVGVLSGARVPVPGGFLGFVLLSITYLWEIPLYLFLSARFGMPATLLTCIALQIGSVPIFAGTGVWWVFPAAVPVRLMCPVLGILPNGLAVPEGSALLDSGVILPGVLLSLVWFGLLTFFLLRWFERRAVGE